MPIELFVAVLRSEHEETRILGVFTSREEALSALVAVPGNIDNRFGCILVRYLDVPAFEPVGLPCACLLCEERKNEMPDRPILSDVTNRRDVVMIGSGGFFEDDIPDLMMTVD